MWNATEHGIPEFSILNVHLRVLEEAFADADEFPVWSKDDETALNYFTALHSTELKRRGRPRSRVCMRSGDEVLDLTHKTAWRHDNEDVRRLTIWTKCDLQSELQWTNPPQGRTGLYSPARGLTGSEVPAIR